jgi:hypothetical protein
MRKNTKKNRSKPFYYLKPWLLCILLTFMFSCSSARKEYIKASNYAFEIIVPSYVQYVDKDQSLSKFDKKVRIKSAMEALKMSRQEMDTIK